VIPYNTNVNILQSDLSSLLGPREKPKKMSRFEAMGSSIKKPKPSGKAIFDCGK